MEFSNFSKAPRALALPAWTCLSLLLLALPAAAQISNPLSIYPPEKIAGKPGETVAASFDVRLKPGYHVNSDKPYDKYLIPIQLNFTPGVLEVVGVTFPKAEDHVYSFSDGKPLSVFEKDFKVNARFQVPKTAKPGPATLTGKLIYQACTNTMCLPRKTIDVKVPVEVR